jgi:hypothetical protein
MYRTPRTCQQCKQPFVPGNSRQRYCNMACAGLARRGRVLSGARQDHPNWKGDAAGSGAKHRRAQAEYTLGPCEDCGATGTDRHHKDSDPGNNRPENIAILCRRCHMERDGRLERLRQSCPQVRPPKPCVNCGTPYKPLRKGRCTGCNAYLRAHGIERPESARRKRRGFNCADTAGGERWEPEEFGFEEGEGDA